MTGLSTLFEGHAAITDAAEQLLGAVRIDDRYRPEGVFLREVLASEIAEHVAVEEGVIYPEVDAPRGGAVSEAARAFAEEFDALRGDWTDYLAAWPPSRIAGEWRGFAEATHVIVPKMLDRIRREDECLYPVALRRGYVTLR